MADGFLNLNKPAGWTSHDCVAKVRRLLGTRKVGHGGTLDPAAQGVLPLAIGQATRFLSFLPGDKRYRAVFRFGQVSDTDDATGEILHGDPCPQLQLEQVQAALSGFLGHIEQVPPIYSAVKKEGKKLYELARQGIPAADIARDPRPIEIYQLQVLGWHGGEFPELELEIGCGAGTYIRALARDLGEKLGCGGLMSSLWRLRSGGLDLAQAISLEALAALPDPAVALVPIQQAFREWERVDLDPETAWRWTCGQEVRLDPDLFSLASDTKNRPVAVYRAGIPEQGEEFLGLGNVQLDQLKALRVLPQASSTRP